jgi:hypothetical protein
MQDKSNAQTVSNAIYVNLENAVVDTLTFKGVVINGYTFITSEKTVRVGFEKFSKGMKVDLCAYLSPHQNTLYLNKVSLAGVKDENHVKELISAEITDISENSIFIDGEEYFFSKHTVMDIEPEIGMKVDVVIYVTAKGRKYINSFKMSVSEHEQKAEAVEGKTYENNMRIKGYIAAVNADKAVRIGNQWYNIVAKSEIDKSVQLTKGECVSIYFYASPKGGNYINNMYSASNQSGKKSA